MRGFRGSRAAQNALAFRMGQVQQHLPQRRNEHHHPHSHSKKIDPKQLPEWLKTPETKKLEREASLALAPPPISKSVSNSKPKPIKKKASSKKSIKKQEPLKLVSNSKTKASRPASKKAA